MKPIPISEGERIAKRYGYDQVVIYARRVDNPNDQIDGKESGEHMTTYGRNRVHCDIAACMGMTLKKFMGWEV